MAELYLAVFGPLAAGPILAFAWWLMWGQRSRMPLGAAGGFTLAAGLVVLLGEFAVRLLSVPMLLPFEVPFGVVRGLTDQRFMIPLVFGILGVILLTFPLRTRRGLGTAELTRRTPLSFTRARWLATSGVVLSLILAITVLAGLASRADSETGEYTVYWVEPGAQVGIGTQIYGWFYSIPAVILLGILVVTTITSLVLVVRPALAENRERDIRGRMIRSRNILAGATGTLFLHLGVIFDSLSATSSIRGTFQVEGGYVTVTAPFSAFGPGFFGASLLCAVLGIALWATIVFSTFSWRQHSPETNPS